MEHTSTLVLQEGALNDDELLIADKGYHFGHNPRFKFCVRYYTFANSWGNHEHFFYAQTAENAIKRYQRETKRKLTQDELNDLYDCIENCNA